MAEELTLKANQRGFKNSLMVAHKVATNTQATLAVGFIEYFVSPFKTCHP